MESDERERVISGECEVVVLRQQKSDNNCKAYLIKPSQRLVDAQSPNRQSSLISCRSGMNGISHGQSSRMKWTPPRMNTRRPPSPHSYISLKSLAVMSPIYSSSSSYSSPSALSIPTYSNAETICSTPKPISVNRSIMFRLNPLYAALRCCS